MDTQTLDLLLILFLKILLSVGFIALIGFWKRKINGKNNLPMIIYWVLGIFFVLMLSAHVFEAILYFIPISKNNPTFDRDSLSSFGYLLGLIFYILIGIKYLNFKQSKL